jgi:hypothetical protein
MLWRWIRGLFRMFFETQMPDPDDEDECPLFQDSDGTKHYKW